MKLYNLALSNFASKSRVAIYEKGLDIELVDPPGGLGSAEYKKVNPLGKVPALDIGGQLIAESEVINEYLEDKFPEKPLLPKDPEGKARVRSFTRHHDLYLEPPIRALFGQMSPKTRDAKVVEEKLADVTTRLDQVEAMLTPNGPWATGNMFTLADAALPHGVAWYRSRQLLFDNLAQGAVADSATQEVTIDEKGGRTG